MNDVNELKRLRDNIENMETIHQIHIFKILKENHIEFTENNNGVFINPADYDSDVNTLYANKVRFNGTQNQRIIKIDNINTESIDNNNINVNTITSTNTNNNNDAVLLLPLCFIYCF